jgi:hypothetical protein
MPKESLKAARVRGCWCASSTSPWVIDKTNTNDVFIILAAAPYGVLFGLA